MNYEEKKQMKLERLRELAQKSSERSKRAYEISNRLSEAIPFGQPILVGHHSESMHRNHIKRIHSAMDKFVSESNKTDYYNERIEAVENNNSISSDDENAVSKLQEKLSSLEKQRELIKQKNKEQRALGKEGCASWVLSNLGQNINSVKKRIKQLEQLKQIQPFEETYKDIKLKVDTEENRVKLFFPGKPSDEVRTRLKSNGFRWSPYNGCWQSFLKEWNIRTAREIAREVA